jgi:hypothetical protein
MFDIYIPTYKREAKLMRCMDSIVNQDFKAVRIVVKYDTQREYVFRMWDRELRTMFYDWAILICDDVEFLPGCFSKLAEVCNKKFPDTDGIVGYNQINIPPDADGFSKSAQIAIGRKFVERFGEHRVHCPDYRSFGADAELGHFADSVRKFYFCEEAQMIHHHPAHCPGEMDETHVVMRAGDTVQVDNDKYQQRVVQRGWTWGKDFLCL